MGAEIHASDFVERDYDQFAEKLRRSVGALERVVARPGFGVGETTIGAELELDLVDADFRPNPINLGVVASADDPRITLELDRFNVEINACPSPLAGRPFEAMERELATALVAVKKAAARHGARVVMTGILPTLTEADLTPSALTQSHRYRALSQGVRRIRRAPFAMRIEGEDILEVTAHDVTFEGANTSFQVHLRVDPAEFARTYNAAQIATAFVLAVSGNSPMFLGRKLWEETRIALFPQSVDDRAAGAPRPSRVSFGHGWTTSGVAELFAESVALHEPLLPQLADEEPESVLALGGVPELSELRLHNGTVWRWNRPVYDPAAGGHLRIEMRALPAGPTVKDMVANAAFALGLTLAFARELDGFVARTPFADVRDDFYRAARYGLDAPLLWPHAGRHGERRTTFELGAKLVHLAEQGLVDAGVEVSEATRWLAIVQERVARRVTGARWQRRLYDALAARTTDARAASAMLARYADWSESETPIHDWA